MATKKDLGRLAIYLQGFRVWCLQEVNLDDKI